VKHILQVLGVNTTALTLTIANINGILTTISLILAIGYTLYKIRKEIKNKKGTE